MPSHRVARPTVVDLFAGAGGLSLGFEQAGFDVIASVEVDPIHSATHHFNFPYSTSICRSVVDLTGAQLRQLAKVGNADVDVVCGGAPCQGFSMIGKRAIDDARNQLVFHFCRLVSELKPKYAVFENVRGLTQGAHKQFLEEIIDLLSRSEYQVLLPYRVLNAADFGVPQNRKRLFLVAARRDQRLPAYPAANLHTTVNDAIGDLPDVDRFEALLSSDSVLATLGPGSDYSRKLRGDLPDPHDYSHPRAWDKNWLTASARTEHTELSRRRFKDTGVGQTEPVSRFLKLDPTGMCNTLRAGTDSARGAFTSPRPIHPRFPRVITVREAARLHSYPDWFRFHATKWHGFRQIGNSVPPLLGRAVAAQIMLALDVKPKRPNKTLTLGAELDLRLTMAEAVRHFGLNNSPIANRLRRTSCPPQTFSGEPVQLCLHGVGLDG